MSTFRAQFTIPFFTGIPEDVVENVWHFAFLTGSPVTADFNNLRDDLMFFYNSVYNNPIGPLMAAYVDPANSKVKMYDLADPTPRAPVYQSAAALSTANRSTGGSAPMETAICVSFQGTVISGVPQARRRGRIFLGGLSFIGAPTTSTFPSVDSITRGDIAGAAGALKTAAIGHGWTWVIWSRATSTAVPVANGWVDNAVDTQRRRGNKATARTTF